MLIKEEEHAYWQLCQHVTTDLSAVLQMQQAGCFWSANNAHDA
jgi:hypothetical protein